MDNLTLSATCSVKSIGTEEDNSPLIITGMANTISKDRAGDVILATAWTTSNAIKNYLKNAIILFGHDHSRPIGKAISVRPTEYGLEIEAEISRASGPIYDLIKEGVLKTFSVGFRCLDAEYDALSDIYIIKDVELLETSVVAVPCNQDSTFQVSKALNAHDYSEFKKQVIAKTTQLSPIEKLALQLGIIKE